MSSCSLLLPSPYTAHVFPLALKRMRYDRSTSISAVAELRDLYPHVNWRLVAIDVDYSEAINYSNISYAAAPATTVMDFNIAAAIWFAARGYGILFEQHKFATDTPLLETEEKARNAMYKSNARIVLAGMVRPSLYNKEWSDLFS